MTHSLVVIKTKNCVTFPDRLISEFKALGGSGSVITTDQYWDGGYNIPDHDIIHTRYAVAQESSLYTRLRDHVKEHGCVCVNNPKTMTRTSDKWAANDIASRVMKTPKTILLSGEEGRAFSRLVEGFTFPVFAKPRYSNGNEAGVSRLNTAEELRRYEGSSSSVIQEAVDFERLYRIVWMGGKLIDVVYDLATGPYTIAVKLSSAMKIPGEQWRPGLLAACEGLAKEFKVDIMYPDLFQNKARELVFNEINCAVNPNWLSRKTGVNHHRLLAKYLMERVSA